MYGVIYDALDLDLNPLYGKFHVVLPFKCTTVGLTCA